MPRIIDLTELAAVEETETETPKKSKPLSVEISKYKGNPVMTLKFGDDRPFTFGLNKAKKIIECGMKPIKDFVAKHDK